MNTGLRIPFIETFVKRLYIEAYLISSECRRIFFRFPYEIRQVSELGNMRDGMLGTLTIGLKEILSLCIFGRPYNLDEKLFVDFNVALDQGIIM